MNMNITVNETNLRGKALCILNNGNVVIYKKGYIEIYSNCHETILNTICLPLPWWKRIAVKFRLFERMLHLDARWGMQQDDNKVLIQFNGKYYIVDVVNDTVTEEYIPAMGKPLCIKHINNIEGFNNAYILGDYYGNNNRLPVNLYWKLTGSDKWEKCYTFDDHKVRHIHNIISDKNHNCLYILTGDEDSESGIWIARNNFKEVEPFLIGKQQYRACQMLVSSNRLFYVTDSPSEKNKIYEIKKNESVRVSDISGTCIYGTIFENNLIFSTTCEPEAHASNKLSYWLSNRSGSGIIKNYVDLCILYDDADSKLLKRFEHDELPLRLFQYGTITFTNFVNNRCYFTPMSVKKYDMRVFEIICKKI